MRKHSKVVSPRRQNVNKVTEKQQLARKKVKINKNAETRTSIRRTPIPVIVRSVTLAGKASGKHFRKKPWPIFGLVSPTGLSLQGFILSRAARVCVCVYIYIIYAVYHRKKQTVFFLAFFFFFFSILPTP